MKGALLSAASTTDNRYKDVVEQEQQGHTGLGLGTGKPQRNKITATESGN